LLQISHFIDQR